LPQTFEIEIGDSKIKRKNKTEKKKNKKEKNDFGPKTREPALGPCWGPSASEGPQKQNLTVFLEYNV
jgi:hypothetical protein